MMTFRLAAIITASLLSASFVSLADETITRGSNLAVDTSTDGRLVMDLAGGVCNLFQILILCWNASDITPLTGDAGKLGLSIETLFFDIIFIFQHYVLYSKRKRGSSYKFLED